MGMASLKLVMCSSAVSCYDGCMTDIIINAESILGA